MDVGTKVKHSDSVISKKRDAWLAEGREPMKGNKLDWLQAAEAERGTIIEVTPPTQYAPSGGYCVQWERGAVSRCLKYMVTAA